MKDCRYAIEMEGKKKKTMRRPKILLLGDNSILHTLQIGSLVVVSIFLLFYGLNVEARTQKKDPISSAVKAAQAALASPPTDLEVCFSPDEPCDVKLTKFIQSAKQSIDVAIYDINLDTFAHHLALLSKKIPVRVVVDRRQSKGTHSIVPALIKNGVNVKYGHQRGIMHNKFTIVDGKFLETGSFNYTGHAAQANNENQVYLANPKVVERYKKRFEELWAQGDKAP